MLVTNQIAFKEWASIVEVLGRGDQTLILRKGGIHEKGKKFDVAYEEFFLFPTFEHQNTKDLKPESEALLKQVLEKKPPPGILPIQFYCVVEKSFWISEEKDLERLEPFHFWSRECIRSRFNWGDPKGLFGILIRVYALPQALKLPSLPRYGGCRSWVELEQPLATRGLQPVLSVAAFQKQSDRLLGSLCDPV